MAKRVPNLSNYVANAYNAKDGNFLSNPVFKLTYNKNNQIEWGPDKEERTIPDQIKASITTRHQELKQTLLMEDEADYDRAFSASLDAEYSGATFSGSAQSSLLYHGNLFASTSTSYSLNFYFQKVLTFERTEVELDEDFEAAIKALPKDISSVANQKKYFDFFDSYGTHYNHFGTMGGWIVMETSIQDSLFESSSKLEVGAAISAGYEGVVASGELNVTAAYKASEFLKEHRKSVKMTLDVIGGHYAPDEPISEWATSIYTTPSLLLNVPTLGSRKLTKLEPISNLVSIAGGDSKKAKNIKALLHKYMIHDVYKDGLLTSPRSIEFDAVYDTNNDDEFWAGDGFVIATLQKRKNGDRSYVYAYDSTYDDPTTIRVSASQHDYKKSDARIPSASLTMPTPRGTYFTSQEITTAGSPSASLQFVGFGNIDLDVPGMQPWQDIDLNDDLYAATDGFVVAYIDWNGVNGARGYIQGQQKLGGNWGNDYTTVAGASQHYYTRNDTFIPTNSFCMPVRKDTYYRVAFTKTARNPTAKAFFVPLSEALVFFERFRSRSENTRYHAKTDGFLVAYLYTRDHGNRAYVDLYSYPDKNELEKLGKLASTSIHYWQPNDTWMPYNAAMIPVSKGNYYKVSLTNTKTTARSPGLAIFWIPLGIK